MKKIKVWINKANNIFEYALVDNYDYDKLSEHIWRVNNAGYASRRITAHELKYDKEHPHKKILMHREIKGFPSKPVDHINRNKLDNRKSNLRVCSNRVNCFNTPTRVCTSMFRGVFYAKGGKLKNRWTAQINISENKRKHLGFFETEIEAAEAYNNMAINLLGKNANINVI